MSGIKFYPDSPEVRKKYQDLARQRMICRLESDILMDAQICELEGWDKLEYLRMLKAKLNEFGGGSDE